MESRRSSKAIRNQIAYEKAQSRQLARDKKTVDGIARRILAIITSKYDYLLVVDCEESALIALNMYGAKLPREGSQKEAQSFVARALAEVIRSGAIAKSTGSGGELIFEAERPYVVLTRDEQREFYFDRYGDAHAFPSSISVRLMKWAA